MLFSGTRGREATVAYDEGLAKRFRTALRRRKGIAEQRMMGGLCFMLSGNMIGGCDRTKTGEGRFMFRVGKDNYADALERSGARPMEMGGRTMRGFVFVDEAACDAATLKDWVDFALRFVKTLPPK